MIFMQDEMILTGVVCEIEDKRDKYKQEDRP